MRFEAQASALVLGLTLGGAPNQDPADLLEPRLEDRDGSTRFHPGLTWLEGAFKSREGQILTTWGEGRWVFQLSLPRGEPSRPADGRSTSTG